MVHLSFNYTCTCIPGSSFIVYTCTLRRSVPRHRQGLVSTAQHCTLDTAGIHCERCNPANRQRSIVRDRDCCHCQRSKKKNRPNGAVCDQEDWRKVWTANVLRQVTASIATKHVPCVDYVHTASYTYITCNPLALLGISQ